MSFEIEGVGEFERLSPVEKNIFSPLKHMISELLFNEGTGDVLIRLKSNGALYFGGATTDRATLKEVMFSLDEDFEMGGLILPSVIPVALGSHSLFGFVKAGGKAVIAHETTKIGTFIDIDIEEFVHRGSRTRRVLIDQYLNVVFRHADVWQMIPGQELMDVNFTVDNMLINTIIDCIAKPVARDVILGIDTYIEGMYKIKEEG